ncbi:MAG: tRNA (adenosine(37)-N6)-dimethylallyltransferase MiaA [Rhodospirillaceae bacterium]
MTSSPSETSSDPADHTALGGSDGLAIVVAGPTASGKSRLALALARSMDGVVINADSMQVYRDLSIMTARPTQRDSTQAPHRLYGFLDGSELCSVARWRSRAAEEVAQVRASGRVPILCGGTGLYIRGLLEGLAPVPDVPEAVRAMARGRLNREGPGGLYGELALRDPSMANRLRPTDSQRVARAWEVLTATGRSLADWQNLPPTAPPLSGPVAVILIDPPKPDIDRAVDERLGAMVAAGGLEEVRALLARRLDPALPILKAVGVPEFAAVLSGEVSLAEGMARAATASRRYAKRQRTWFRNQLRHHLVVPGRWDTQLSESFWPKLDNFLHDFPLTASK